MPLLAEVPANDPGQLPKAVVSEIVKTFYAGKAPDNLSVKIPNWIHVKVDLNGDGKPDYIVARQDPGYCGSGGCSTMIIVSSEVGYRSVLSNGGFYGYFEILNLKTNGFNDIAIKHNSFGNEFYYSVLWYDGQEYQGGNPGRYTSVAK